MSRPSSVYSSSSVDSGETERPLYRPVFGIEYLMGDEEDVAYLTPDELCEIKPRNCCELVRAHNQLEFFFHALDAFPAFVRSLPFQPPLFCTYWATRWASLGRSIVILNAYRSRVEQYAVRCAPDVRAMINRCFGSLWVNMELTHDAVLDFLDEVKEVDRHFQQT